MNRYILILVGLLACAGCGGSSSSSPSCVATTSCCSGVGYSTDGGTTCYRDSGCSKPCLSGGCVANSSCCGGSGYSTDGGTTCYNDANCASGCNGSTTTVLKVTNTGASAITIGFVGAAYGGTCPEGQLLTAQELAEEGWCTSYEDAGAPGAGKCLLTLGVAGSATASAYVPNSGNKCISGNFGAGGYGSCQTTQYPNGWTQGEFTLNPKETTQEAVDISAVNGVNYAMSITLADAGWAYEDSSSIVNQTVGPNQALDSNIGIKGVYPPNCTDCIQLVGDITCSGLTPNPPTCNSTRICNVYRSNSPGGTVEFKIGDLL